MARHPSAHKVHRQSTEPDDAFVARLLEFSEWAKRNARIVVGAAVVVVLVIVGFLYYTSRRQHLNILAEDQLAQVRESIASGNAPLAAKDLETFLKRFSGTNSAPEARILLAQVYLDQGESHKALSLLQSFSARDQLYDGTQLLLLGAAYEQAGDTTQAIQTYTGVGNNAAYDYQRREGLENAARLQMAAHHAQAAIAIYQKLVDMSKGNQQQQAVYQLRLAEARTEAAAQPAGSTPKNGSGSS